MTKAKPKEQPQTNAIAAVADALNQALADSYALYFKSKNFHWHVSGPHFVSYHELFDQQATEILAVTDAMAERVRKRGGTTLRSVGQITRLQRIEDNNKEEVSAREMLAELHRDNLELAERFREAKQLAEEADDDATAGVIDEWIDQAEERAWFLLETSRGQ